MGPGYQMFFLAGHHLRVLDVTSCGSNILYLRSDLCKQDSFHDRTYDVLEMLDELSRYI